MTIILRRTLLIFLLGAAATLVLSVPSQATPILSNPVLVLTGVEYYTTGGKQYTRYRYTVDNRAAYPNELFAASPNLPPCGQNTKSSRTWVDLFDQRGKRLYGFCALGKAEDLSGIWFALETEVVPPSWIYIEMTDRQTQTKYKSNLAETTL
jgi:hypothetical protein